MLSDGTGLTTVSVSGLPTGVSIAYSDVSPDGQTNTRSPTRTARSGLCRRLAEPATEIVPAPIPAVAYGSPSWSPGGTKIAYGTASGIGIVDADGTNATLIPTGGPTYSPAWSPLGTELAYVNAPGPGPGTPTIVSAGASTVPPQSGGEGLGNEWSADGTKLVYSNWEPSVPFSPGTVSIETIPGSYQTYAGGGAFPRPPSFTAATS